MASLHHGLSFSLTSHSPHQDAYPTAFTPSSLTTSHLRCSQRAPAGVTGLQATPQPLQSALNTLLRF